MRFLFVFMLYTLGCSSREQLPVNTLHPLDSLPGIQGVHLGENINKYKAELIDSLVTTKEAFVYIIGIEKFSDNCDSGDRIKVVTFKDQIMMIEQSVIEHCPGLIAMFTNKYGKPNREATNYAVWETSKNILEISAEGGASGDKYFNITFLSQEIHNAYNASIKGNL